MKRALLIVAALALLMSLCVVATASQKSAGADGWTVVAQASSSDTGSSSGTMGTSSTTPSKSTMGTTKHKARKHHRVSKAAKAGAGPSYAQRRRMVSVAWARRHGMMSSAYTRNRRMVSIAYARRHGMMAGAYTRRHRMAAAYGAGPSYGMRRYHRIPRAGMDLGLLSLAGGLLTMTGFALRRRSR